ncbi:MAG: hypothetical protein H6672_20870 [Anaerolineaceae bacterium]|nr:hypothetical protein [Anaerolineaceae bacterium]
MSNCYDQCANWPLLTVDSADSLVAGAQTCLAHWGTTERQLMARAPSHL